MTTLSKPSDLHYRDLLVRCPTETGLICLSDLWIADRSPTGKKPSSWIQLKSTQKLFRRLIQATDEVLCGQRITEIPGIFETDGLNEECYAAIEIAVIYARFLSAECFEWALAHLALLN